MLQSILLLALMAAEPPKLRVAHIGLELDGAWRFSKDAASSPHGSLVGIADAHEDLRQRAKTVFPSGVEIYADYRKMLDELKPDAVLSTTPNAQHLEIVRECAKRKIHVWFQKPMATRAEDAREMLRLAEQAGIQLMISDHTRFGAVAITLENRIRAGLVGETQNVHINNSFSATKVLSKYYWGQFLDPARHGGGAIMDQGSYGINWALTLLGRPVSVFATGRQLNRDPQLSMEDHGWVMLQYPGAVVIVEGGWYAKPDFGSGGRGEMWVSGPLGRITRVNGKLSLEASVENLKEVSEPKPIALDAIPAEMADGVTHFLHALRYGKQIAAPHTARTQVVVNEVVDAAYESIRTGKPVVLSLPR